MREYFPESRQELSEGIIACQEVMLQYEEQQHWDRC